MYRDKKVYSDHSMLRGARRLLYFLVWGPAEFSHQNGINNI